MDKDSKDSIVYKNIYYMLMYAIDELRGVQLRKIDSEEFKPLNNLYASILNTSMLYVLNSGILQEYKKFHEYTNKPKGKINIASSIKSNNYQKGLIECSYFRLNIDNSLNRVIKLAIRILLKYNNGISKDNISNLKLSVSFLTKVSDVVPKEIDFDNIDTKNLGLEYKTAFYMSKLIIEEFMAKENGSNRRIIEMEDTERMHRIFEKFVRNYYIVNYSNRHIKIGAKQFSVRSTANTIYNKSITDITIENKQTDKIIIIDTKWYKEVLNEKNKLDSENQRQIKEYVRDYKDEYGNDNTYITGILLYAKPNTDIDIVYTENGYLPLENRNTGNEYARIYTKVIDLEQQFSEIEKKLGQIFEEYIK